MSFRNRCIIAGANGPISLSIPLEEGRGQRRIMKDVKIANREKWQDRHWKTLVSAYNRSPWFAHFEDELSGLYRQRFSFLVDWNSACFDWAVQKLEIECIKLLDQAAVNKKDFQPVEDWRNRITPASLKYQDDFLVYRQVFEERIGFQPNLSILDLIFCEGPGAARLLRPE